jgi:hypothetical protein
LGVLDRESESNDAVFALLIEAIEKRGIGTQVFKDKGELV